MDIVFELCSIWILKLFTRPSPALMTKYATMATMLTAMRTRSTRRSALASTILLRVQRVRATLARRKEIQLALRALVPVSSRPATWENELEKKALRPCRSPPEDGAFWVEPLFCWNASMHLLRLKTSTSGRSLHVQYDALLFTGTHMPFMRELLEQSRLCFGGRQAVAVLLDGEPEVLVDWGAVDWGAVDWGVVDWGAVDWNWEDLLD